MNRWALLSTAYLAPVQHYALMYAYGRVCFEACERYVKQSFRNRCVIATAGGVQTLTVPVVKPSAAPSRNRCVSQNFPVLKMILNFRSNWLPAF